MIEVWSVYLSGFCIVYTLAVVSPDAVTKVDPSLVKQKQRINNLKHTSAQSQLYNVIFREKVGI